MSYRENLESEARAKLIWGDSPESVSDYLKSQGLNEGETRTVMETIQRDRAESVRASAKRKIIIGILLVLVPIVSYFIFLKLGFIPIRIFAATIVVGLYGSWRLVNGTISLLVPSSEKGDLSEDSI